MVINNSRKVRFVNLKFTLHRQFSGAVHPINSCFSFRHVRQIPAMKTWKQNRSGGQPHKCNFVTTARYADYHGPPLTDDEVAFYDAPAANASAVKAMGDDKLKVIATELITKVRQSVTIDGTLRESARAKIKVMVKRILNKYG